MNRAFSGGGALKMMHTKFQWPMQLLLLPHPGQFSYYFDPLKTFLYFTLLSETT